MEKYPSIPRRRDEDYHSIKNDTLLEYVTVFGEVGVLMNQPLTVFSTQQTHRNTPRAHRTPTLTTTSPHGKKRKQIAEETSLPRKLLKVTIKQKKQSTPSIPPPSDDRERDEIAEATLLSLTLHKTALAAKAQENVAKVQEKLAEEEIEKMVEEPRSHKENLEVINDDDDVNNIEKKNDDRKDNNVEKTGDAKEKDNDDHTNHSLIEPQATGSKEIRTEKMIYFTQDKDSSWKYCWHVQTTWSNSLQYQNKFVTHEFFMIKIQEILDHYNNVIPKMTFAKPNEMIKKEMPHLVNLAVNKDREINSINVPEMISKEFATHGSKMIEDLFHKHMQNTTLNLYPTPNAPSSSTATVTTADLKH
ncbi:hypothetical protein Tco_0519214 [Tanacetum coccineum]